MKLNLGVLDVPYRLYDHSKPVAKPYKHKQPMRKPASPEHATTGTVAEELEEKYGIMQVFADRYQDRIAQSLSDSVAGAIETMAMGGPQMDVATILKSGIGSIERDFKNYLDQEEIAQAGVEGVPTKAALLGINHRMKKPTTHKRRPSFIDTGQYQSSFKAWVDDE